MLRKSMTALSAIALLASPAVAAPAERAPTPVETQDEMVGTGVALPLAIVGVIIALLVMVADNGDGEPESP